MSRKTKPELYSIQQKRSSVLPKILIIVWLLVIVGVILLVKEVPLAEILSGFGADSPSTLQQETTEIPKARTPEYAQATEYSQATDYAQATEVSETPEYSQAEVATITPEYSQTGESPAEQYKFAIANGKPTLVFFHSNTCQSCLKMIDTVNQVYPEFSTQVVLIDVNVYDPQNEYLIYREGINYIPTLVFYNQTGDNLSSIGVISSEELRQKLSDICQGKIP